jgi:serine/threonine protein kinase
MAAKFPGWVVLKTLDEGGQAHVFLVRRAGEPDGAVYVLKSLKNSDNTARLARFEQEIQAYRTLEHTNILRLVDAGKDARGRPFLVSEYCERGSLEDEYERNHPWRSVVEMLGVFFGIVRGLAHAHRKGVIHRDLKPANIFLRKDRTPVVGDFGLCFLEDASGERLTRHQEVIGSRWFAAPEVRNGRLDSVTPAVDIYSLGKILYWLLSYGRIFDREDHRSEEHNLVDHRTLGVWEPGTSLEEGQAHELVNDLLDEMIVLDPGGRIKNADELEERVNLLLGFIDANARPILLGFPHRCNFCRQGEYRFQNGPFDPGHKAIDTAEALGLKAGWQTGSSDIHWMIAICNMCGHVELFRPDLVPKALDRWRRGPPQRS